MNLKTRGLFRRLNSFKFVRFIRSVGRASRWLSWRRRDSRFDSCDSSCGKDWSRFPLRVREEREER